MNNEDILLHTYSDSDYSLDESNRRLEKILDSGALLSKRQRNINVITTGFNGMDYISLVNYNERCNSSSSCYCAFNLFSMQGPSLIFDKTKIKYVTPKYIKPMYTVSKMNELGNGEERYSDLVDEVQIKDKLSLDNMIGISIPTKQIYKNINMLYKNKDKTTQNLLNYIVQLNVLLKQYNYNVPIVDVKTLEEIKTDDDIVKLVYK